MLRHIVFWNLQDKDKAAELKKMKETLLSMKGKVEQIKHIEVGLNIKSGPSAFDIALVVDLADEAALDAYQDHPEHFKVKEYVGSVAVQRAVVDYIVE